MDYGPCSTWRSAPAQGGFTLIELIIVIAIVAILITVGVPSMREWIANQKVRGSANDLQFDLSYARSEAVKRNANVVLVPSGAAWADGWSVQFGGTKLREQPAIKGVTSGAAANLTFGPNGRPTAATASPYTTFSSSSGVVSMRCITISPSGRAAVQTDRNHDGDCTNG